MSKYRLEKESGGFAIVHELREFRAGSIRTEYRLEDQYGDEIAVVKSMDDAVAALANHLLATAAPWEDGGAGRYLKVTHEYFDTLLVEHRQDGLWMASRNDYPLGDGNGPVTFSTASQAKHAADLHAHDARPESNDPGDGLHWLVPSDAAGEDEDRYRIEDQLGHTVADAAEALSRARTEHESGGIRPETTEALKARLRRLRGIREASLFGSYNTEHCSRDRYFFLIENGDQSAALGRISFDEAAYHYGKLALRHRLGLGPSDTALQQMISNVLQRIDVLPMAA
jgi:hypothetical protein